MLHDNNLLQLKKGRGEMGGSISDSFLGHYSATSEPGWYLPSAAAAPFAQSSFLVLAVIAYKKLFLVFLLSLTLTLASGATEDF